MAMGSALTCGNSAMLVLLLLTLLLTTTSSYRMHYRRRHTNVLSATSDSSMGKSVTFSNAYKEEEPCASDIPTSAYVKHIPRRRRRHQGGESCPYKLETTTDKNRIPAQMTEAKCQCKHCRLPYHLLRRPFRCLPIYHMVPVMRRSSGHTRQNGGWVYALERVSVGCTCRKINPRC